jgi:hypothetical protein
MTEFTSRMPSAQSRSFGQTLAALQGQYLRVLTRPSVKTFLSEKERCGWGLVWFQMLTLGIICALILAIAYLISPPDVSTIAGASGLSKQTLQTTVTLTVAILTFILMPISFLVATGILYLIARAFGGRGTYLQQISVTLLFGVPLVLLSTLLSLVPSAGAWLAWLPHVYSAVLIVLAMVAVHSRKKV